ncbi:MAG: carbohydrate porin [Limisphaerales bacterium]
MERLGVPDFRERWEDRGVRWNAYLVYYQGALLDGGRAEPAHRGSGSADLIGRVDLERLADWRGLDLLTHFKSTYGRNINPDVGARSQVIDDADFTDWFWIDQVWLRQRFNRHIAMQAGYLDQQTILDRNVYANAEDKQFLSQYLDNNNAIIPLKVGLGATVFLNPTPTWDFSLGFADGDNRTRVVGFDTFFDGADSLIWFTQVGRRIRLGQLPGNYRVGAYLDTRDATRFRSGATQSGQLGVFVSCDQKVYRENETDPQGLGLFARYGYHDERVNRFAHFWSLGFQYDGPLPGRDQDRWGAALYSVHASADFRAAGNAAFTRETGYETYYHVQVSPWITVTPDLQYIVNPGGSNALDNALAANLRIRLTF